MTNKRSGAQDFLVGYLAGISSPKTAEEMNVVLNDIPNEKLAEERIIEALDSISPQELIRFYFLRKEEGMHYDDICVAVEERIITALSDNEEVCYFSIEAVQQLADIGFAGLLAGKNSKLRLNWEYIDGFPFRNKVITDFFRESFRQFVKRIDSFGKLKGLVKREKLPRNYLEMVLERAEILLPELPTVDLEKMARRYENRPWCRPAVFLPIIREVLAERYIDEALETDNLHSLLLSKPEALENDKVWSHFLNLLQKSSLKDIEGVFGHKFLDGRWLEPVSKEKLPSGYLPVLVNYYGECLDATLPAKEDDFAWLWHCLAGCPFPVFYDRISEYVLSAISTVSPERAWEIAEERDGNQLSFCRRIIRQRYIAWFLPKIATKTDVDKLHSWLFVCKKPKHRRRIKLRLKEIWRSWSFEKLGKFELDLDGYQIQINNLYWVAKLRKTILREKLSEYLQSVQSLDDLAWAYGLCGIQEHQRKLWTSVTGEILQRMPVRILLSWYKIKQDEWNRGHQDGYHFAGNDVVRQLISRRLVGYAEDSIRAGFGIPELRRRMREIPEQFNSVREIFDAEIECRIGEIADIREILPFFGKIRHAWERFFQLLPEALRDFSGEEIEELWEVCRSEYDRKKFLKIAVAVRDGRWDFEVGMLKSDLKKSLSDDGIPF